MRCSSVDLSTPHGFCSTACGCSRERVDGLQGLYVLRTPMPAYVRKYLVASRVKAYQAQDHHGGANDTCLPEGYPVSSPGFAIDRPRLCGVVDLAPRRTAAGYRQVPGHQDGPGTQGHFGHLQDSQTYPQKEGSFAVPPGRLHPMKPHPAGKPMYMYQNGCVQ